MSLGRSIDRPLPDSFFLLSANSVYTVTTGHTCDVSVKALHLVIL